MLEDGHCLRDQAMGFCFQAGAREDTHFRATSMETLRNMVAAGSGITLLPDLAIPPEHKRDGVCYLSCTNPEPFREVILVYRRGRRCAAVTASWQRLSVQKCVLITSRSLRLKISG